MNPHIFPHTNLHKIFLIPPLLHTALPAFSFLSIYRLKCFVLKKYEKIDLGILDKMKKYVFLKNLV